MTTNTAYTGEGIDISLPAGADLSSNQFCLVKYDSSSAGVILCAATTDQVAGVLQNKPISGEAALVRVFGVSKVKAGAAITQFAQVSTDSAGALIAAATGGTVFPAGKALLPANTGGDIVTMLVNIGYVAKA